MAGRVEDKVAIVTGAAAGMGRAHALTLARANISSAKSKAMILPFCASPEINQLRAIVIDCTSR